MSNICSSQCDCWLFSKVTLLNSCVDNQWCCCRTASNLFALIFNQRFVLLLLLLLPRLCPKGGNNV